MEIIRTSLIILTAFALVHSNEAECIYSDSSWSTLSPAKRKAHLKNPDLAALDTNCFSLFLSRYSSTYGERNTSIPILIEQYTQKKGFFSRDLLFSALREKTGKESKEDWNSLIAQWEKLNGPLKVAISRLHQAGNIAKADSLFRVLDHGMPLTGIDLIRWAQIKGVLEEYEKGAQLLCRIIKQEPQLKSLAQHDLSEIISDAPPEEKHTALNTFKTCYLQTLHRTDEIFQFRQWIAKLYLQHNFDKDAVTVLLETESDSLPIGNELLSLAMKRYRQNAFGKTIYPARTAYNRLDNKNDKVLCATLLSHSYQELGVVDSAIWWLEKTGLGKSSNKINAVTLYQNAGLHDRASKLINSMPPSINRDTLLIRQYIFTNKLDSAKTTTSLVTGKERWRNNKLEASLWKLRILLFSGKGNEAKAQLDSLNYQAAWPYAAEVLHYDFTFRRIKNFPDAFKDWGMVEHAYYTGNPGSVVLSSGFTTYPPPVIATIALRLSRAFMNKNDPENALITLNKIPHESVSPEVEYIRAEALIEAGRINEGKTLLEQLIMDHPHDVFSNKARILIMNIPALE
ncbi:MAG: hypothetical protein GF401_06285 [Chitinivibrionales bacterium]|nr:hypothetical protein [Chitinivibrionales bacterium]